MKSNIVRVLLISIPLLIVGCGSENSNTGGGNTGGGNTGGGNTGGNENIVPPTPPQPPPPTPEPEVDTGGSIVVPIISADETSFSSSYKKQIEIPFSVSHSGPVNLFADIFEEWGTATIKDNILTFTPNGSKKGNVYVTVFANEPGSPVNGSLTFFINLINSAPSVITPFNLSTTFDNEIIGVLPVHDIDNDALFFTLTTAPKLGNVSIDNIGNFTYKPSSIFNSNVEFSDTFSIKVSDGEIYNNLDVNINLTEPDLLLKSSRFTSKTEIVRGKFTHHSSDSSINLIYTATITKNANEVESFTVNNDGTFEVVAKPYADPITMTVTLNLNGKTDSADMFIFPNWKNDIDEKSDPLYFQQWHLNNTGQNAFSESSGSAGFDINIEYLHERGITGEDIEVATVDTGLELSHEDLIENIIPNGSYDFVNNDLDPSPEPSITGGDHGTSVAGLIGAKGFNNLGGRGVAPDASLTGFNYLLEQSTEAWISTHGGDKTKNARVINQSYGYSVPKIFLTSSSNFEMQEMWLENHYKTHPQPALLIKSAGNGFNYVSSFLTSFRRVNSSPDEARLTHQLANGDPGNASFYNTLVSALGADANSPRSSYSTVGSSVLFSAPGGEYGDDSPAMITTDVMGCDKGYSVHRIFDWGDYFTGGLDEHFQNLTQCSYTSEFNGTSSAAPVASGVAALVMEANPQMTWRDVRYVMAKTATKIDEKFEPVVLTQNGNSYTAEHGWVKNAAGNRFHNWYGFGMVNAASAVKMATRNYVLLPPLSITPFISTIETTPSLIPENFTGITHSFEITENLSIEAVQLKIKIDHDRINDLSIEIISPNNTKSIVATARHMQFESPDVFDGDGSLLFLSHAFLDENSQGTWKVRIIDTNNQPMQYLDTLFDEIRTLPNNVGQGQIINAAIRIYGH
ncbi:S8 family serine peptidase [Photobacterium angustum]|uniref:P/Homo B domain-containing protein n=1 Tax=Photobacterium angustum TaxID=661 RepID=A0A855SEJ2_PHOAN|nr:S8 family serine peptidase [Photobacterium angustum]PSX07935.1 hypothetical protein C0W41_07950 [Photobacterium angustum]PSX15834.1 hypothetical protein C0W55_07700 [Photobacterium angustum]PSX24326.1 hypothetical protein C0W36_09000 [Photobacterium angustum]PSX40963.1 hypothetical protein C0W34_11205 [Photobacterium angustum]